MAEPYMQDHRHNSERFAKLTAATFLRHNIKVYLLKGLVCTPMVPFTIGRVGAAGGVMITASHNPAKDNGCKASQTSQAGCLQTITDLCFIRCSTFFLADKVYCE